jgi:DNA-binding NarL/FixJ family response regulator
VLSSNAPLAPLVPSHSRSTVAYWKQRLINRPYPEARLGVGPEYSVRMEQEGSYNYFPLGSNCEDVAAAKALEIHRAILRRGWQLATEQFAREITLAIFWADNPSAVTYTTLFTFTGAYPDQPAPSDTKFRKQISVIEPDPTVQSAVRFWLDRQPGFSCPTIFGGTAHALSKFASEPATLLLLNRSLPNLPQTLEQLKICYPNVPVFTYRIHEDSDQIFISISGVTGGYILRRRVPTALFDPINGAVNQKNFSAQDAHRHVRDYFQSFFAYESATKNPSAIFHLSAREQEILNYVSKGHLDKEIAASLGLSVFTIHNHLKNIYEKLGVHNRTEAVSKYLQK